ncbi:MAG: EpsG family protein [Candidatus Saccharibacteria bacterium]|nr:EpsG family protein [Candidatus Saccharibacteria bacterium]
MINFDLIYVLLSAVLTFFFPLFAIPVNLLGVVFFKKTRKASIILLALSFALVAYAWNPPVAADLYRHHAEMSVLRNYDFARLIEYSFRELNFLQVFTEFLVSKTGNYDLLQLIITFIGYYEIFWMICNYAEKKEIRNTVIGLALILVIVSLRFIDFASGLWFFFAIINLVLGLYLRHFRNTKKLHWLFYVLALLSHVSVLFILVVVLLSEVLKSFKKASWVSLVILFVAFSTIGFILNYLCTHFDFYFLTVLQKMYQSYFVGSRFSGIVLGWNLYLALINIAFGVLVTVIIRRTEKTEYNSLILLVSASVLALILQSGIFTRFAIMVLFMSLMPLMEIVNAKQLSRKKLLVAICFCLVAGLNVYRQIEQIAEYKLISSTVDSYFEEGDI